MTHSSFFLPCLQRSRIFGTHSRIGIDLGRVKKNNCLTFQGLQKDSRATWTVCMHAAKWYERIYFSTQPTTLSEHKSSEN